MSSVVDGIFLKITFCERARLKGLTAENLEIFQDFPLIAYALAVMDLLKKQSDHQIDVALNIDSKELQKTIEDYLDVLLIERKKEHATDTASKMAVILDTYLQAKKIA